MQHKAVQPDSADRATRGQSQPATESPMPWGTGRTGSLLKLQRARGNRHVEGLLQTERIQTKLMVGAAGDEYEQEADQVARQVLSVPDDALQYAETAEVEPHEERDERVYTHPIAESIRRLPNSPSVLEEEEHALVQTQRTQVRTGEFEVGNEAEAVLHGSKGQGNPLPDTVREFMEPRFGTKFDQVRVHTGSVAASLNRELGASAFTYGRDIYYGTGRHPFDLGLTAHELTHVVQQTGGSSQGVASASDQSSGTLQASVQRTCPACAAGEPCDACSDEKPQIQRSVRDNCSPPVPRIASGGAGDLAFGRRFTQSVPTLEYVQRDEENGFLDNLGAAVSSVVDAVLPTGLLEKARGGISAAEDQASSVEDLGEEAASDADNESQGIGTEVQSDADAEIQSSEEQAQVAANDGQTQAAEIEGSVASAMESAEAAALSLNSAGNDMEDLLNPAAPVLENSESASFGRQNHETLPGITSDRADSPLEVPDAALNPREMPIAVGGEQPTMVEERRTAVTDHSPMSGPDHPAGGGAIPGAIVALGEDVADGVKAGLGAGGTPGWDCDAAEVVAIAGNVSTALTKAAISVGQTVFGKDRFNSLLKFGNETIEGIKSGAAKARAMVRAAKEEASAAWEKHVTPYLKEVEKVGEELGRTFNKLKQDVSKGIGEAVNWAAKEWDDLKKSVVDTVSTGIESAKKFVQEKVDWVRNLVTGWNLPDWLKTALSAGAGLLTGPAAVAMAAAQRAADYVASHKEEILGAIRKGADFVVQDVAERYSAVKQVLTTTGTTVKGWITEAGNGLQEGAESAYVEIDNATNGSLTKVGKAVGEFGKQVKGEACAALGKTVGPCANQFLPPPGKDAELEAELKASGEVEATIEGVPVKLAGGASLQIVRKGDSPTKFTVVMKGEGSVGINIKGDKGEGSGPKVSLGVDLPAGGNLKKSWDKLTGKSTPANTGDKQGTTPTPPAQPPATTAPPAPGSQPPSGQKSEKTPGDGDKASKDGLKAEAEVGLKGSLEMSYEFEAGKDESTCNGLGGMTAFLATQGVAVSSLVPFGGGIGLIGQAAFADRLSSCKFTAAEFADVSVDLMKGGAGALKLKLAGERGIELETKREFDPLTGKVAKVSETATLKTELSGKLAAELGAGPLSKLGGAGGMKGSLSLSLEYLPAQETINALNLEAKLGVSVETTNWSKLRDALPDQIASKVDTGLQSSLGVGTSGVLTAEASYKVSNLQKLAGEIDSCLSNPETVSADRVWSAVTAFLGNSANRSAEFKVELTETSGGGITFGAELPGKEVGGKVSGSATIKEKRKKTLYSGSL